VTRRAHTSRWLAALWLIAAAGCLHEASETCGNGGVCPPGLHCVDSGSPVGDGRICVAGTCGNGRLDPGETCDDGNNRSGDGCPADCTRPCGDGVLDPGEVCDDGNNTDDDGCSADCLSLDGISLVTPASVVFQAVEGDRLPAAITVTVRLPLRGDTVAVGDPPGAPRPSWLAIASVPAGDADAAFELRVLDTQPGERSARVRLTIRHRDGGAADTFDLPIVYRVAASDLAVRAMPVALSFTATEGNPGVASQPLDVTFNGDAVALVSAPSWLTVTGPAAPGSPASFTVAIDDPSPVAFTMRAGDLVFTATRGPIERSTSVHVEYQVLPRGALAISVMPRQLGFAAVTGAAVPPPQTVSVTFTGDGIDIISAPSWLTVTVPSPPISPAAVAVSVNTTSFAGGTRQQGTLVLGTTHDGGHEVTTVHVDYDVHYTPELLYVAPYVGFAGRSGTLHVHGRGLATGAPVTIQIGDQTFGPVTPDNDTLVTLSVPALPVGRYPVTLIDPPVVSPRDPELVIVAAPAFAYQAIDAHGTRKRLLYDAERQMLYSGSWSDQRIERFSYAGGTWTKQPEIAVAALADIAMAPDGRSLIVVKEGEIDEMSLSDGQYFPVERAPFPNTSAPCNFFSHFEAASNGKLVLFSAVHGSGICPAYFYDLVTSAMVRGEGFYLPAAGVSRDGSRIYAHGDFSSDPFMVYDALSGTTADSFTDVSAPYAFSIDGDGSRMILDDRQVYNGAFRNTGNVPYQGPFATRISHDGSRAFIYPFTGRPRIEIYDLNGPLQSGAMYPLIATIPVPDAANGANEYEMAMTSTPDDAVLFVSGASKLLVIPIQ